MVRGDPGLIQAAIKEILRYDSPLVSIPRTAIHDAEFGGRHIQAGDRIAIRRGDVPVR